MPVNGKQVVDDPFVLSSTPKKETSKANGSMQKKSVPIKEENADPFVLGSPIKKKESSDISGTPSQNGTEDTAQSPLASTSADQEIKPISDIPITQSRIGFVDNVFNARPFHAQKELELKKEAEAAGIQSTLESPTPERIKSTSTKAIKKEAANKSIAATLMGNQPFDEQAYVKKRTAEFNNNFIEGTITPEDVETLKQNNPLIKQAEVLGASNDLIAKGINDKTSSLRNFAKAANVDGEKYYHTSKQLEDDIFNTELEIKNASSGGSNLVLVDPGATKLNSSGSSGGQIFVSRKGYVKELEQKLKDIQDKKFFLQHDFAKNRYNPKAEKVSNDIIGNLKKSGQIDWAGIGTNLGQVDNEIVRKYVNKYLTDKDDPVINAGNGVNEIPKDAREYNDIINRVSGYFNDVAPVEARMNVWRSGGWYQKKDNQKFKPLIDHLGEINKFYDNGNTQEFESTLNATTNANQTAIFKKYNDILSANKKYNEIGLKFQQQVKDGVLDGNRAAELMQLELNAVPELKKILSQGELEMKGTIIAANKQREKRLIDGVVGLQDIVLYDDGMIGVKGATKEESKKFLKEYYENEAKGFKESTDWLSEDRKEEANKFIEAYKKSAGPLTSISIGLGKGYFGMMEFATRWTANNMGIGTNMRDYYSSINTSISPLVDNSDFAEKHFKYNGILSLADPSYYAYSIGQSAPYIVPAVGVSLLTGGGAVGAVIAGTSGAALETAQNGIAVYSKLLTTGKDEYGLPITPYAASKAMAEDMGNEILPNIFLQSLEFGTLMRGAKVVKPKLNIAGGLADLGKTGLLEGGQEGLQGLYQYNAEKRALGEKTLDLFDYMQTDDFRQNFYGGLAGGIGFGAGSKTTVLADHAKNLKQWEKLVNSGNIELAQGALYGRVQQAEANGQGTQFRDGLRLRIENEQFKDAAEREQLGQMLAYSERLSKAKYDLNVSVNNVNGMGAAHNLAMADMYETLSGIDGGKSALSKIYATKSKDYQGQAQKIIEGNTNDLHYVLAKDGSPIYLTKDNAKALEQEGVLDALNKKGVISGVSENLKLTEEEEKDNTIDELKKEAKKNETGLSPEENSVIDILKNKKELADAAEGTMGRTLYDAAQDPTKHKDIIKELVDQSSDPTSLELNVGAKVADAVLSLPKKSEQNTNEQLSQKADTQILNDRAAKIGEEIKPILQRVNDADYINEKELNETSDKLYDVLDEVEKSALTDDQKESSRNLIEPLISKLEGYEFRTKTETSTVTEKVPNQVPRKDTQREIKPALEQSKGSSAIVTTTDGNTVTGTLDIKGGQYVLDVPGGQQRVIGEKAITDRDLSLPTEQEMENPVELDDDGNVKSVTFKTKDGDFVKITDPEKALDLAIKLRADITGDVNQEEFDTVYDEVSKEVSKEVLVNEDKKATPQESKKEIPEEEKTSKKEEKRQPSKKESGYVNAIQRRKELADELRGLLGNNSLGLTTDPTDRVSFKDIGIIEDDTIETAIDKAIAYGGELVPFFESVKKDPYLKNVRLQPVNSRTGLENGESGLYHPVGHGEGKDGLLQIANKDNVQYTLAHELAHFLTLDSKTAEDVKGTQAYKALADFYNYIASKKGKPVPVAGNVTVENYGLTNVKEFMAELLINPSFRKYASDVFAENKEDIFKTSKQIRDARVNGIAELIYNFFKELFAKLLGKGKEEVEIDESKPVIENAARIATELFFGGNDITQNQSERSDGGKVLGIGNESAAALALPSGINEKSINDFVRDKLKQGISPEDIAGALEDNGIDADEAKQVVEDAKKTINKKSEVEKKINEIGSNAEDVVLEGVNHRRDVSAKVSVSETAKEDKLRLELTQDDSYNLIQDMKQEYGKPYLQKVLSTIKSINKNKVNLDKILAVGVALENEISGILEGYVDDEFNLSRGELNKIYSQVQQINVANARISSKALNTVKTLYNSYENTVAKESILTEEQSKEKEAILSTLVDDEKLSEAADEYEQNGVRLTPEAKEDVAKKDTRKPKIVTAKTKIKTKIEDILKDLNDNIKKLDC